MLEGSAALVLPVDNFRGSVGPTQVRTTYGDVQGYVVKEDNARVWQGIPYAAPPVGTLRWTSPSHPEPWTTPKNVTSFKPGCPQVRIVDIFSFSLCPCKDLRSFKNIIIIVIVD